MVRARRRLEFALVSRITKNLADQVPAEIREMLGPPPLMTHERIAIYYAVLMSFAQSVQPTDFVEWVMVKDMADARSESARLRKIKSEMMNQAIRSLVSKAAASPEPEEDPCKVLDGMMEKVTQEVYQDYLDERAGKSVVDELAAVDWKALLDRPAQSEPNEPFEVWMERIEQIEPLLQGAETRFTAAREDLQRYRRTTFVSGSNVIEAEIVGTEIVERKPATARRSLPSAWQPAPVARLPRRKSRGQAA
jgi:hypothetical protein